MGKKESKRQGKSIPKTTEEKIYPFGLGLAIKDRRKKLGLKIYELANRAGVNPVYITQIEKGFRIPSPHVLQNILEKGLKASQEDINKLSKTYTKQRYSALYDMVGLDKIGTAIETTGEGNRDLAKRIAEAVTLYLNKNNPDKIPSKTHIEGVIEKVLIEAGYHSTARHYISSRKNKDS
jgi:transcriptional regulator with XRE-family HTH domain